MFVRFKKYIFNPRGSGLLSTLIASGIGVVVLVGLSVSLSTMKKSSKDIKHEVTASTVEAIVYNILQNVNAWKATLSNINYPSAGCFPGGEGSGGTPCPIIHYNDPRNQIEEADFIASSKRWIVPETGLDSGLGIITSSGTVLYPGDSPVACGGPCNAASYSEAQYLNCFCLDDTDFFLLRVTRRGSILPRPGNLPTVNVRFLDFYLKKYYDSSFVMADQFEFFGNLGFTPGPLPGWAHTDNDCVIEIGLWSQISDDSSPYESPPFCEIAIGNFANTNGFNAMAIGSGDTLASSAQALSTGSMAIGSGAIASGEDSVAIGTGAVASSPNSVAIGQGAQATADKSVAIGPNAQATAENSIAIGPNVLADVQDRVQIGNNHEVFVGVAASAFTASLVQTASGCAADSHPVNNDCRPQSLSANTIFGQEIYSHGVYKCDSDGTNCSPLPDYVFDYYFDGKVKKEDAPYFEKYKNSIPRRGKNSFEKEMKFIEKNRHLPALPSRASIVESGSFDSGEKSTSLWVTAEIQAIYLMEFYHKNNELILYNVDLKKKIASLVALNKENDLKLLELENEKELLEAKFENQDKLTRNIIEKMQNKIDLLKK